MFFVNLVTNQSETLCFDAFNGNGVFCCSTNAGTTYLKFVEIWRNHLVERLKKKKKNGRGGSSPM